MSSRSYAVSPWCRGARAQLKYATGPGPWCRTAPQPAPKASHSTVNACPKFGSVRTGAVVRVVLSWLNALLPNPSRRSCFSLGARSGVPRFCRSRGQIFGSTQRGPRSRGERVPTEESASPALRVPTTYHASPTPRRALVSTGSAGRTPWSVDRTMGCSPSLLWATSRLRRPTRSHFGLGSADPGCQLPDCCSSTTC
jgi:hypothetical protein